MESSSNETSEPGSPSTDAPGRAHSVQRTVLRVSVLLLFLLAFVVMYLTLGKYLSLEVLASREAELRQWRTAHPLLSLGLAFVLYVVVTGFSLPGAAVLTVVCGWLFGFWQGLLLVSFASTSGATLAFLFSRYLFRDAIQSRFGDRLSTVNAALEREGAFYLFSLRLIPVIPFFVINAVMGLTKIRVWTFWWVSQLGMLAGTCVFVYAGAQIPTLDHLADEGVGAVLTPRLIIAFVLLGLFPLLTKKLLDRVRPDVAPASNPSEKTP